MKVKEVAIEKVVVGERFRKHFGELAELVESIKTFGILQPISIDSNNNLLAGERRLRAAKESGLTTIPCVIRPAGEELDLREVELEENIQRLDLGWKEKINLTKRIFELKEEKANKSGDPRWSVRKQADLTDESKSLIQRRLEIADALEVFPDLAHCKSEEEAFRLIKRVKHDALVSELQRRAAPENKTIHKFAEDHYIIGDALEEMKKLNPGVFNFAEVDPPYGIDLHSKREAKGVSAATMLRYQEVDRDLYPEFLERAAKLIFRSLYKDAYCVWWYGWEWHATVLDILRETGFSVSDVPAIWTKTSGQASAPETSLASCHEPFFVCRKGQPKLRGAGHANVFPYQGLGAAKKIHPTERPIEMMVDILETFAYPSATILVPFLGSGVTLRAAYKVQMKGIGWDLDELVRNRFLVQVRTDMEEKRDADANAA